MKRLLLLIILLVSPILRADPSFITNAGNGLISSSSVTYSTSIVSVAFWVTPRATNIVAGQYFVDSSTSISGGAGGTPRFAIGIFNRSSALRLDWIAKGGAYRSQSVLAAPNVPLNVPMHVGGVFDVTTSQGSFKGYINGIAQTLTLDGSLNSMSATAGSSWQANQFCIGSENAATSAANAVMTEVAIWSGELTATQFANLAKGMRPISIGRQPIAYWPLHPVSAEVNYEAISGNALTTGTYSNTNNPLALYRP